MLYLQKMIFLNVFFSLKELKQAVQAGAKTTPSQDSISNELLKHLDDVALEEILALSNYVWEAGVYLRCGNRLLWFLF